MSSETIIYIIIAGIIALLLALFQYKMKSMSKLNMLFTFLRFLTIFSVLLLLINPKFEQVDLFTEKPNLVVAVDNSSSIIHLNHDKKLSEIVDLIENNKKLQEKFNIDFFSFGEELNAIDSLKFNEQETNIDKAFRELSQIYKNTISPIVLLSDGNQTYGNDYSFSVLKNKQSIYTIILGDTIAYSDLKIEQLNVNKYTFLKNKFPVEAILVSNGKENVSTRFVITSGNTTVYSKRIDFTKEKNSALINFTLPANSVGVYSYKATLVPLDNEKNKINNSKNFAIEVIDEKTKVAIVSNFIHPDLGSLKKSIESNEQRSVTFFKPNNLINQLNDFQLVILYQPNNDFKNLYKTLDDQNKNRFVIGGTKTNWRFLNSINKNYSYDITNQVEDYQAEPNTNYSAFIIEDLDFNSFPPLKSSFGEASFTIPTESLLYKKIGITSTTSPLLATFEINSRREAVLFGENLWQWRAQSFINNKSFNNFDNFLGKLIQYLASNKRKNRLNVEYESFYEGNNNISIKAQFFNKNYEFDTKEMLNIFIKDNVSNEDYTFPFILRNNNYQVDLSNLPASDYSFTVKATNENIAKSGNFIILEYNIEQQFLNANVTKLQQLATNSDGESYFIANYSQFFNDLLLDKRYLPIQKSTKNIVPLIDWKYLLALIVLCLAIEWFLRKYNGLI